MSLAENCFSERVRQIRESGVELLGMSNHNSDSIC
jgi:hypothetical protein